ncbi:hypothetical protein AB0D62_24445 [Streptomyces massasporeus]
MPLSTRCRIGERPLRTRRHDRATTLLPFGESRRNLHHAPAGSAINHVSP